MATVYANSAMRIKLKKIIHASGIMDGHAHNNSGATCPLPLVYAQVKDQAPVPVNLAGVPFLENREMVEWIIARNFPTGIQIQKFSTCDMGNYLAKLNRLTFAGIVGSMDFADEYAREKTGSQIASPVVSATMDMEKAHIAGYSGQNIYHEENGELFYYKRSSGEKPESEGKKINLSHEIIENKDKSKTLKLQKWKRQFKDSVDVAINNPLHILPLIFHDPRRNNRPSGTELPESMEYGAYDETCLQVATDTQPGIWFGIKMYPPLGHKPFDEMCDYLPEFYHRCEKEKIPILIHCSPGGMTTHEARFYREYDRHNSSLREAKKAIQLRKVQSALVGTGRQPSQAKAIPIPWGENIDSKERFDMDYFFKSYVHPEAWRPVLENFPDLHLNLAHFGGDEFRRGPLSAWRDSPPSEWIRSIVDLTKNKKFTNLYTDISCFNLANSLYSETDGETVRDTFNRMLHWIRDRDEYKHLRNRMIFGTDWYLTHLTRSDDGAEYGNYCRDFKKMIDQVDPTFWIRFSLVNPWTCYSMTKDKIDKMKIALQNAGANQGVLNERHDQLIKLNDEVARIQEQLAKWDA